MNYLLVFLFLANVINAWAYGIYYYQSILFVDALSSIGFSLIGFLLHRFHIRQPLRHFLIWAVLISIFNIGVQFGDTTGIHFYLLYLIIIVFLLLDNWWLILFYTLLLSGSYLVYDLRYAHQPLHPDTHLHFAYIPNFVAAVAALVVVLIHHKKESAENQKIVEQQNRDLAKLNLELMFQKDSTIIASNKLEQRRKQLEVQNTSILDSLRLASLVQQQALPPPESIFQSLASGFLWYKPKDMVSGDFYWCKSIPEGQLIVIADCVGHGVPGGMRAVLSLNLITQVMDEKGISTPASILKKLDDLHRRRMKSEQPLGITDGMDIAVCLVQPDRVLFSSAGRKLVYINIKGILQVLRGNPHQLATTRIIHESYMEHEIPYEKGDRFYLFTDGVTDQLGGIEGHRFGSKQLLEVLASIQHLNMDVQKTYLERKLVRWQGSEKQTDDMLMIGFQV